MHPHILHNTPARRLSTNLDIALLDIALQLLEARLDFPSLPSGDARVENVVHFLEGFALGFRGGEEHVDEG